MIVALVVAFAAATGFAVAAIPSRSGVIHACYKKKGGALRVVSSTKNCHRGTRKLSWNQKGAKGSRGSTGAQGIAGKTGDPGTAVAYARVAANGSLEPGDGGKQNKNVGATNVQHAAAGVYCFGGLPFGVASAMVSPDSAGDQNGAVFTSVAVQRGITLGTCDANHQQARVTTIVDAGATVTNTDHRFQIWFEATGGPQIAPGPGGD
jgi:hypothetical protein